MIFIMLKKNENQSYFNQESERLIYRKLTENDIESWTEFFVNNDRLNFLGIDEKRSRNSLASEWIHRQLERYDQDGFGHLALIKKISGEFIGLAGILSREIGGNHELEIGYSLKPTFWKKGYGSEAAIQIKKFGIENNISNRFISIIHKENIDSINVAKKNNMIALYESNYLGMDVIVFGIENY